MDFFIKLLPSSLWIVYKYGVHRFTLDIYGWSHSHTWITLPFLLIVYGDSLPKRTHSSSRFQLPPFSSLVLFVPWNIVSISCSKPILIVVHQHKQWIVFFKRRLSSNLTRFLHCIPLVVLLWCLISAVMQIHHPFYVYPLCLRALVFASLLFIYQIIYIVSPAIPQFNFVGVYQ